MDDVFVKARQIGMTNWRVANMPWNWMAMFMNYTAFMRDKDEKTAQIPGGSRQYSRAHEKSRRRMRKASQRRNRG